MKVTIGKLKEGEYRVGESISVTDVQEVEVSNLDPMLPHAFVSAKPYTAESCLVCGRPETAMRHHYMEDRDA